MTKGEIDDIVDRLISLHLEEAKLLQRLRELRTSKEPTERDPLWARGDQVQITNTVMARGSKPNEGDRLAIVRKFTPNYRNGQTQVYVTTDNSLDTWRLEKNLAWISCEYVKHE